MVLKFGLLLASEGTAIAIVIPRTIAIATKARFIRR
jgi:hypothetical protein